MEINNSIKIVEKLEVAEIVDFLYSVDDDFIPKLSKRLNLNEYANKLNNNASFILAYNKNNIIGLAAVYDNDYKNLCAYLPIIGIKKEFRGQGIGKQLLDSLLNHLKKYKFQKLSLETWLGSPAQTFYEKNNFIVESIVNDRPKNLQSVKMFKWLANVKSPYDNCITNLEFSPEISKRFSVNLFIKRDDNYPKFGGGNKARKLDYILNSNIKNNYNAVVTSGGNQSNHVRATALYAASMGWKSISVIHDKKPKKFEDNLKIVYLSGSEIRHVEMAEVKEAMDTAMEDLKKLEYKPLYIWGGGHCLMGSYAYYMAVFELKQQLGNLRPDYIVMASGTGTTQAGLEVGIREIYPDCKVLGISVARDETKGKKAILDSMIELNNFLKNPINIPDDVFFDTDICGIGYQSTKPEIIEFIKKNVKTGLLIDPTYTGKALYAMNKFIESGIIKKGSNIVFWHTGGIFNLLASKDI
tara:strand:- start:7548 stop:8954 length:1407 start_codon:yes stop_codon:yes gene_type:complete